ncbi:MAG: hypothetical protein JRN39_04270 [Nitrososphaerota archaeon]|nr:hypothetical protein [Nitrososphaerota archaeon]MDG6939600.1 hypothetical protein [Nitrososphaerota archaeon]
MDKEKVQSLLKGNTLRTYVYCLKNRKVGVREVQRSLRFSNPSLAQYHLSKLVDMGLLKEAGGEYEVASEVKVDVMRDFLRVGTLLLPRFVFYAVFFTVFAAYFVVVMAETMQANSMSAWATALLLLASLAFWYETVAAWRSSPSS